MELPKRLLLEEMTIENGEVKLELQEDRDANKKYYVRLNKAAVMRIKAGI